MLDSATVLMAIALRDGGFAKDANSISRLLVTPRTGKRERVLIGYLSAYMMGDTIPSREIEYVALMLPVEHRREGHEALPCSLHLASLMLRYERGLDEAEWMAWMPSVEELAYIHANPAIRAKIARATHGHWFNWDRDERS